jgi:hypothetical protein
MKAYKIFSVIVLVTLTTLCFSQSIQDFYYEYTYDASGNRIKRAVFEIPDMQQQIHQGDTIIEHPELEPEAEIAMIDNNDEHNTDTDLYGNNELLANNEFQHLNNDNTNTETDEQAGLNTKIGKHNIMVFPNPVREVLRIEIEGLSGSENAYWQLVDMQGRTIETKTITNYAEDVVFSNIQPGTYLLMVYIDNKKQEFKIIRH